MNGKLNYIDLFAGCGGLSEGFQKTGLFDGLAHVEWNKSACDTLENRLKTKWNNDVAEKKVLRFDIQKTNELLYGWDNAEYGKSGGLLDLLKGEEVDVIIGGPPCQAYSLAGRIRDEKGMQEDYRNYLFESYLKIAAVLRPKILVFENVPGLLSARPGGIPITERIQKSFFEVGYDVSGNLKSTLFDLTRYGVPQKRKRLIILGVNRSFFKQDSRRIIDMFYNHYLPEWQCDFRTVKNAIGDLPPILPLDPELSGTNKRASHYLCGDFIPDHVPRYHNQRDIEIFKLLAKDIESGSNRFVGAEALKKLYFDMTGKSSNVHKYYVLRWNEPSNTIPAHIHKDGLRHIHPDSKQARSLTVRECARLQTFDDDFIFLGSMMERYKMIGNAVPPLFAKAIGNSVSKIIRQFKA